MADSTKNASRPTPVRQGVATKRSGSLSTERPSAAQAAGLSTEDPSVTPPNQSLPTSTGAVPQPDQSLPTSTGAVPPPDQSLPTSTGAVPPPDQSLPTSTGAVPQPDQSLITSTGAVPQPDQSVITSIAAVPQPDQSVPTSTGAVPQPDQSVITSTGAVPQPDQSVITSIAAVPQPDQSVLPTSSATAPQAETAVTSGQDQLAAAESQMKQGQSAEFLSDDDRKVLDRWRTSVKKTYPKCLTMTYFLPPFFFRRIRYILHNVLGENVLVPMPPRKEGEKRRPKCERSKIVPTKEQTTPVAGNVFTRPQRLSLEGYKDDKLKDDIATEVVLNCLRILSGGDQQGEVMMVISQLRFRKYLDGKTDILHAAENQPVIEKLLRIAKGRQQGKTAYTRAKQKNEQEQETRRGQTEKRKKAGKQNKREQSFYGDFDVLIIHRCYGFITVEVKALGADMKYIADLNKTVAQKMKDAVRELNDAEDFLNKLVADIGPVNVTKTIILPHINSRQLTEALETDNDLKQDFLDCLGGDCLADAVSRCLCFDQIPQEADIPSLYKTSNAVLQHPSNQPDSTPPQSDSTPPRSDSTPPQSDSTPPRSDSTPPRSNSTPPQSDSTPPQSDDTPQQSDSAHQQSSSTTSSELSELSAWWKKITEQNKGPDPNMSDDTYEQLLARFCGPATTVDIPTISVPDKARETDSNEQAAETQSKPNNETGVSTQPPRKVVKTQGQAIAETGLILSTLTLLPYQVDLLNDKSLTRVHLWGPPGTGKTVVLVLKATGWLREGLDVDILSINSESRAISILMESQLQQTLRSIEGPEEKPKLRLHVIGSNLESWLQNGHHVHKDTAAAVSCLAEKARDGKLHIIADEIFNEVNSFSPDDFCNKLETMVTTLSFWCAGLEKLDQPPSKQEERLLDSPLRTPPKVTKEVSKSSRFEDSRFLSYNAIPTYAATCGPDPIYLKHYGQAGHQTDRTPQGCRRCGKNFAAKLKELHVGKKDEDLQYRDVLILYANPRGDLHDEGKDAFIRGLEENGIPVQVLPEDATYQQLRDVALTTENKVTVSHTRGVSGLERRVVVGMGGKMRSKREDNNRLLAMSRCTSNLIWIEEPSVS